MDVGATRVTMAGRLSYWRWRTMDVGATRMSMAGRLSPKFLVVFMCMVVILHPVIAAGDTSSYRPVRDAQSSRYQPIQGTWRTRFSRNPDHSARKTWKRASTLDTAQRSYKNGTFDDPLLDKLFNAVPVEGDNGPGNIATGAITNSVKAVIPVSCYYWETDGGWCGKFYEHTFRSLFAPGYHVIPYEKEVAQYGYFSSWLPPYSVVAICKAMYDVTSKVRPTLNVKKINEDLGFYEAQIKANSWKYYAFVFSKEDKQFAAAFASIPHQNITMYKNKYIYDGLLSSAWITAKQTEASEGTWRDPAPAWEMFHHSIKLHLLGANQTEIDMVLQKLVAAGLPFPEEVQADNWETYSVWLKTDVMRGSIKSAATPQIVAARDCGDWMHPVGCCKHGYSGPEYQSCVFTESGFPGHKYVN